MSNVRRDVDWQAIKNSYRCATPGIRMLAEIHGVSEGTIRARARREGWKRDLAAAVRATVKKRLALSPHAAAAVLSRRPMVALQREDIAECTALWRSWGEQRAYRDIDGNVRLIGWNAPKRDRPRCGAKTRAGGSCNAPGGPWQRTLPDAWGVEHRTSDQSRKAPLTCRRSSRLPTLE
jgi:hypothetical protein